MNGNTKMPTIEFGEDTTYDALHYVLWRCRSQWAFHLADGRVLEGVYVEDDEDSLTIDTAPNEATPALVTFDADLIVKVVYL